VHRILIGFVPVFIRDAIHQPGCISRTRRKLLRQLEMRCAGQMDGFFPGWPMVSPQKRILCVTGLRVCPHWMLFVGPYLKK